MPANSVLSPYPTFFDATGAPLENGLVYIGQPGFEARSTPKASFFDVALTIPTGTASGAAIRTKGGFPINNSNAPAMFYVDGDFSISVCDRNGVLLYSALNFTLAYNVGGVAGPVLGADGSLGAVGIGFANEPNTGFVRSGAGTMQTVIGGTLVSQQTNTGTVFQQPVSGAGFNSGVLAVAQPVDADLTALGGLSGTGIAVRTAANTWAQRTITSADNSVTIANPGGVAGNIDLSVGGAWTTTSTVSIASGTSADLSIPSTAREIIVDVINMSLSGGDDVFLRFLESGTPKTTGYNSAGLFDYGNHVRSTNSFYIRINGAARAVGGKIFLNWDAGRGFWFYQGFMQETTAFASTSTGWGWCNAVTGLSGLRFLGTAGGSFDGAGGTIQATYR